MFSEKDFAQRPLPAPQNIQYISNRIPYTDPVFLFVKP